MESSKKKSKNLIKIIKIKFTNAVYIDYIINYNVN